MSTIDETREQSIKLGERIEQTTPRELIGEVARTFDVPWSDVTITYSTREPEDDTGLSPGLWIEIRFVSKFAYGRGRSHKQVRIYGAGATPGEALDQLFIDYVNERNNQWQRDRKAKQKSATKAKVHA